MMHPGKILALLMPVLLASCEYFVLPDPDNPDPEEGTSNLVEPVVTVAYTVTDSLGIASADFPAWAYDTDGVYGSLVSSMMQQKCSKKNAVLAAAMASESGSETPEWGYRNFTVSYSSTDALGKEVILSERIVMPVGVGFTHSPKGIALVNHPTIGSNRECPTMEKDLLVGLAALDYVAVFPDMMGFGASKDRIHPYLCGEITARHALDGVFAALCLLYDRGISLAGGLVNVGYSQGGASALAVHKYIETALSEDAREQLRLKASYCGGGPYSPSATWDAYTAADDIEFPAAAPMTIIAFKEAYPREMDGVDPYDCLSEPVRKDKFLDKVLSKDYSVSLLNAHLKLAVGSARMSDILSPALKDDGSALHATLRGLLDKNELASGWSPQSPVRLFHVPDDEVVPYVNYEKAMSGLAGGKVSAFKSLLTPSGSHSAGGGVFYLQLMDEL